MSKSHNKQQHDYPAKNAGQDGLHTLRFISAARLLGLMHKMRFLLIAFVSLLLSGCPIIITGNIKNSSEEPITAINPWYKEKVWEIQSGGEEQIFWNPECLVILQNEKHFYFPVSDLPDNVYHSKSRFSSRIFLYGAYKQNILILLTKQGSKRIVKSTKSCPNA